jgi:hypothetical protein
MKVMKAILSGAALFVLSAPAIFAQSVTTNETPQTIWRQVDCCGQEGCEPAAELGVTQHLQQEAQRAPAVSGVRKSKQMASV